MVSVPGRGERLDVFGAALAIGIAAHLDDFDDTHLATVIHPGAATLATVLPLGATLGASGERVLRAFAVGCEAQLRLGNAISPEHYDAGWHITGTCGVVGAAVAAAVLRELDATGLETAVALAATQTLGQREAFGSMTKPFHPGQAAANGLLAALLAERGFPGVPQIFERPGGFFAALTTQAHPEQLLDGLGERWELEKNTFKPYPCGIVSHPLIDAAVAAAVRIPNPQRVQRITAHCHPLVVDLMGRIQPADGLQARFSAAHTIAAALADGELTLRQFRDERVTADDLRRLRAAVRFETDPEIRRDEARLTVHLDNGTEITEYVEHARGSLARPLTDAELTAKARNLIEDVLPGRTDRIIAATALDTPDGLTPLINAITPETTTVPAEFDTEAIPSSEAIPAVDESNAAAVSDDGPYTAAAGFSTAVVSDDGSNVATAVFDSGAGSAAVASPPDGASVPGGGTNTAGAGSGSAVAFDEGSEVATAEFGVGAGAEHGAVTAAARSDVAFGSAGALAAEARVDAGGRSDGGYESGSGHAAGAGADSSDHGATGTTSLLAGFAAGVRVPDVATAEAVRAIEVVIAATPGPEVAAIAEVAAVEGDSGKVGVPGRAGRFGVLWAAVLTGAAACGVGGEVAHSTGDVVIVAAALAVGSAGSHTLGAVAEAVAVGREVVRRMHIAIGVHLGAFDSATAIGRLGAAAAAGRLLGLHPTVLAHALGMAATQAAGFAVLAETPVGALQSGKAAGDAVQAAYLARAGFTAAPTAIEGRRGLAALLAPGTALDGVTTGLGVIWRSVSQDTAATSPWDLDRPIEEFSKISQPKG